MWAMSAEPPAKSQSRTWGPYSIIPIYRPHLAVDVATYFRFEAHAEGTTSPWEMQKHGTLVAVTPEVTQSTGNSRNKSADIFARCQQYWPSPNK